MKTKWEKMLKDIVREYRDAPATFLRQPTISRTVHPKCNSLAKRYYAEMKNNAFCVEHIFPNLRDSAIGKPYRFDLMPECSPMSITHSYQLYLLKQRLGIFLPRDRISYIVEIGGGYGHTCRMIRNFDYTGRYSIIDFPEMLEIQKTFLEKNSIHDVGFYSLDMEAVRPREDETSILIATFSVNEKPLETRQYIEPYYDQYDYILFAHNAAFDGIDNVDYFSKLKKKLHANFEIDHFKDHHRGLQAWFMICARRGNNA